MFLGRYRCETLKKILKQKAEKKRENALCKAFVVLRNTKLVFEKATYAWTALRLSLCMDFLK